MRVAILAAAALLAACAAESVPIRYGGDSCAHCRMTISDARFGAEVINRHGRPLVFDAIECLASYLDAHPEETPRAIWVTDYAQAPRLVHAQAAVYVHSPRLQSPMGANLAAFAPGAPAELTRRYGGEALTWTQVRALVRERARR